MTPMVDVAFLLLIFFMVTTVFRRPPGMEMNIPKSGDTVKIKESNVMTIYVLEDGR
jgi:biopolymer transport protein ExbD